MRPSRRALSWLSPITGVKQWPTESADLSTSSSSGGRCGEGSLLSAEMSGWMITRRKAKGSREAFGAVVVLASSSGQYRDELEVVTCQSHYHYLTQM